MRFSMKHELQLASHNPKIVCICHTMTADTQNKLHRRPVNGSKSRTPPRTNMRTKGAGTGTNHDPGHGGIT